MCGRYTIAAQPEQLAQRFDAAVPSTLVQPRYNAAPTQELPVLLNEDPHQIELLRWGLIPIWAKDPSIGNRMINVRAETVEQKPSFRDAVRRRRCLVLADGFYEWQRSASGKRPMRITLKTGEPFAFAGIWENWHDSNGALVRTFGIITTEPNELLAPIHNRMPVILLPENEQHWLNDSPDTAPWQTLLRPYPAELMTAYEVSKQVNTPANDTPAVMVPA